MRFIPALLCIVTLVACAAQVDTTENTGTAEEGLTIPACKPQIITPPSDPLKVAGACIFSPNVFFKDKPVYYFLQHQPVKIQPGRLACGGIIDQLQSQCYQTADLGWQSCDAQEALAGSICQVNAQTCVTGMTLGCDPQYMGCEQIAASRCTTGGVLDLTCYSGPDSACLNLQASCENGSQQCVTWEINCADTAHASRGVCQAGVTLNYQNCVSSLGSCI